MAHNNKLLTAFLHVFFTIMCIACIIPVLMVISASLSSEASLVEYGYTIFPKELSLDSYKFVFSSSNSIFKAYGITIFVTVGSVILGVMTTAMYAYVITRPYFKQSQLFSFISYFTMLFNGGLVATYLINVKVLNLSNSILALILPGTFTAWNVMVTKSFFNVSVPDSIVESAKIDGAGEFKIFMQIVMPISLPCIATIALFITMSKWNDWMSPMLYITEPDLYTLSFLLQNMLLNIQQLMENAAESGVSHQMEQIPSEGARMALCIIAAGPILIAYPFFQKYFVQGMTVGAVKG